MEPINLPILSPRADLTGIDQAISELEKLDALLKRIAGNQTLRLNVQVSGAEGIRGMAGAYDDLIASLRSIGQGGIADQVARGLITPREATMKMTTAARDLQNQWRTTAAEIQKAQQILDKSVARGPAPGQTSAEWSASMGRQRDQLAAFGRQQQEIFRKAAQMEAASKLAQSLGPREAAAGSAQKLAGEETKLAEASGMSKDALAAQAMVVAEKTKLMNALSQSVAKVTESEKQLETQSKKTKEAAEKPGTPAAPDGGALLGRKTVLTADGDVAVTEKFRTGQGRTLTNRPDGSQVSDLSTMAQYAERQKAIDADYKRRAAELTNAGFGKGSAQRVAALRDKQAALEKLAAEMNTAGLPNFGPAGAAGAIGMQLGDAGISAKAKADKAQEAADRQAQAWLQQQEQTARKQAEAQRRAEDKEKEAHRKREKEANERWRAAAMDRDKREAEQAKAREQEQRANENRRAFESGGAADSTKTSRRADGSTTTTSTRGNQRFTETRDASGNVTASKIDELNKAHRSLGDTFVANTAKVAMWTASVGALYGALGAIKTGFGDAFDLDRKFATLSAVFNGTNEQARGLMNTTLALGVAHGRAAGEAVDAVTEWSRAQLTAAQAGEALRVSLQAANVAEITSAEAGKNLAAIYQTNSLRVTELAGVLGQFNQVSNTTKTTTKDILDGFAAVGPLAAEAGISIAKTSALVGTTVAATARTGSQIGTSFKALIVSLSDPRIQEYLRGRFGIESRTAGGDIKSGQEQLDDLFVATRGMNRGERGEMLVNVAGKHQASKIEAMLENYPEAARKAIESQLELNSAQREENKILDTTLSKWESLKTSWASAFDALHQNVTKTPINWLMGEVQGLGSALSKGVEWLLADDPSEGNFLRGDSKAAGRIMRSEDLTYEEKIAQNDILNINQAGANAAAYKGMQEFIARTMKTAGNSTPQQFAKDAKQLAMTLERDPQKREALLARITASQGDLNGMGEILAPYMRRAQTMEKNSILSEVTNREFAGQKADYLELDMQTNPDFAGDTARAMQNRERRMAIVANLRESAKPVDRTTFSEDETGRRAALLVTPAQETAAALAASGGKRGLFGEGFSYRLRAMSDVSAAGARLDAIQGRPGVDIEEYTKAKADLMRARAELRVSGRNDIDMEAGRAVSLGMARIGGGTEGITAGRRADFFEAQRAGALGGGVFGDRGREVQLVTATTAALREQQDLRMQIARTEADIVTQRERQNIEAGKALQLASREDQARAAMLGGFAQRNGALSPEQFQFFSSDFRQAAVRLNPDAVPKALTGAGEMEQNLAMLKDAAARMDATVSGLLPLATAANRMLDARDAQLSFEMNIDVKDSVSDLMQSFSELATARLEQVITSYSATVDAAIQRMMNAGARAGAGAGVEAMGL